MQNGDANNRIEIAGGDWPFFRQVSGKREGLDLHYNPIGPLQAFAPVLADEPFQVNEFSLANYSLMRDRGVERMVAIPVFLNRAFRHGSLYVRRDSDLTEPAQLRGKTIGAREYSQTAGVWWRGTMIDEYDVHWRDLKWVAGPNPRFAPPEGVTVDTVEGDLEAMVADGTIDALLAPFTADEKKPEAEHRLRPLLPDTEAAERDYFARTGIYPLNHTMVIHADCLAAHGAAPHAVFAACSASKQRFYAEGGNLNPWGDAMDGDPIPFGLTEKNREVIATLLRYLNEQGFIARIPDIDALFVDGAADFVDA